MVTRCQPADGGVNVVVVSSSSEMACLLPWSMVEMEMGEGVRRVEESGVGDRRDPEMELFFLGFGPRKNDRKSFPAAAVVAAAKSWEGRPENLERERESLVSAIVRSNVTITVVMDYLVDRRLYAWDHSGPNKATLSDDNNKHGEDAEGEGPSRQHFRITRGGGDGVVVVAATLVAMVKADLYDDAGDVTRWVSDYVAGGV
ncbi:hypothetical protein Tco_0803194 [Tanacetum coccineum]|uniref:Uncharacterized protein n=1 Tax=Tanacetum coccineum TaxID=301880 RepID=A0ABQ5A3L8_9ASTR